MTLKEYPQVPITPPPPPIGTIKPYMVPIQKIVDETPLVKSYLFKIPEIARRAQAGQFLMVWIPGIDEIPMSVSWVNAKKGLVEFAAARVGDATTHLHQLKKGAILGLRGPLGNGFRLPDTSEAKPLLIVGGGCGSPPLLLATKQAVDRGLEVHVVLGAKTQAELLYESRLQRLASQFIITTDDGSAGIQGTVIDGATFLIQQQPDVKHPYGTCLGCGSEPMLKNLIKFSEQQKILIQVSLERYMKCGIGLCGHCIIDRKGTRVCTEGPVFTAAQLRGTDFGYRSRDASGRRTHKI